MEELLLINPRRRAGAKRRGGGRTAAQKRATARLVAMNKARRRPARRRNPNAAPAYVAKPNPRRRRRSIVSRARTVARRRYRRNPAPRAGNLVNMLMSSAQGAIGAVVVNTAFNFIPLPAAFKNGNMQYVAKAVMAIGLGMLVRNRMVSEMVKGSMTVTMHDAIKDIAGGMIPGMGLGYYPGGMMVSASPDMRAAPAPALSEYINRPAMAGMGSVSEVNEYSSMY